MIGFSKKLYKFSSLLVMTVLLFGFIVSAVPRVTAPPLQSITMPEAPD